MARLIGALKRKGKTCKGRRSKKATVDKRAERVARAEKRLTKAQTALALARASYAHGQACKRIKDGT